MEKTVIAKLLNERDAIYKKDSNSKKVDEIKNQIMKAIKKNFNKYEVDFIVETLTRFGDAPCIIYDDNGLFAVTGDGYQPVVTGRQRIEGAFTVFVETKQWKKTIREALKNYLSA